MGDVHNEWSSSARRSAPSTAPTDIGTGEPHVSTTQRTGSGPRRSETRTVLLISLLAVLLVVFVLVVAGRDAASNPDCAVANVVVHSDGDGITVSDRSGEQDVPDCARSAGAGEPATRPAV